MPRAVIAVAFLAGVVDAVAAVAVVAIGCSSLPVAAAWWQSAVS